MDVIEIDINRSAVVWQSIHVHSHQRAISSLAVGLAACVWVIRAVKVRKSVSACRSWTLYNKIATLCQCGHLSASRPGICGHSRKASSCFPSLILIMLRFLNTARGFLSSRNTTNSECLSRSTYAPYCTPSWRGSPNHGPKDYSVTTGRNDSTTFKRCTRIPPNAVDLRHETFIPRCR